MDQLDGLQNKQLVKVDQLDGLQNKQLVKVDQLMVFKTNILSTPWSAKQTSCPQTKQTFVKHYIGKRILRYGKTTTGITNTCACVESRHYLVRFVVCFPNVILTLLHGFDPYIAFYLRCYCSMFRTHCNASIALRSAFYRWKEEIFKRALKKNCGGFPQI